MAQQFRSSFKFPNKELLHWFPGHMGKGLRQMQQKLKQVDCVIEVHDARIPISGRNINFKSTISGVRPHILVLNKRDLSDKSMESVIHAKLVEQGSEHVIFTNCKDQQCRGVKQIVPLAKKLICSSNRYNRSEEPDLNLMIIGVPNVGKSSLINILRNLKLHKKSVAPVGAVAGITRAVQTRIKVNEDPPMYLLDTPGILNPRVKNMEEGFRLALCASLQDHLVGEVNIADYLLYILNKNKKFEYVKYMHLRDPTDDVALVLVAAAVEMGKVKTVRDVKHNQLVQMPDMIASAQHFIRAFREGKFGRFVLDSDGILS